MRDKGLVVSTKNDLAQVEVHCLVESCQSCSALKICIGQKKSKGYLSVKNPLQASAGDEVEIEIPEGKYSRALIVLFASLLLASLSGLGIGHVLSYLFSSDLTLLSLYGLFFALFIAGIILFHYFRKKKNLHLYPVIIDIIKKGASNEKT